MKYISLCAGIGGFDLGFDRAGMTCAAQVENDKFCQDVLAAHWPDTPKFWDICEFGRESLGDGTIDLACGGTPCQDISIAGQRAGLAGERSRLFFEFTRVLTEFSPRWFVFENVTGLLSGNERRDMGTVLREVGKCGYGWAYRVLDAQYFGVPQRRRRVFIVGYLGDARRAGQILFESTNVPGNSRTRPEAWETATEDVAACLNSGGNSGGFRTEPGEHLIAFDTTQVTSRQNGSNPKAGAPCHTLTGNGSPPTIAKALTTRTGQRMDPTAESYVVNLRGRDGDVQAEVHAGAATALRGSSGGSSRTMIFQDKASAHNRMNPSEVSPTVDKSNADGLSVYDGQSGVRRLTPLECERLQGFPDGWTDCCSDTQRYKQTGNAVCVPVAEWIGCRIMLSEWGVLGGAQ